MNLSIDEFQRKFTSAYKSSTPIICVETPEEEWATQFFIEYIDKEKLTSGTRTLQTLFAWSRAFGFTRELKISAHSEKTNDVTWKPEQTRDPINALKATYDYIKSKSSPAALFLIRDLDKDLEQNLVVQRLLREIFMEGEGTKHIVVLLQSDFSIPGVLEKELVLMDFASPSTADHKAYFDEYIAAMNIDVKLEPEQLAQYFATLAGLTRFEANHLVMEAAFEKQGVLDETLLEYAKSKKKENIRKGKLLEYVDTTASIKDIGGLDLLKEFIEKEADATTPKAREYGIKPPKGIILFGPPGTGKTAIAKAIANNMNMPLIAWNIGKMFGGLVGSSEATTRRTTKQLEQFAPAVVLLDELDKYLGGLKGSTGDSGVGSRVLGEILSFMNDTTAPLFFVATSNSIDLPPEIMRKGRWDELFYVPLPAPKARRSIFKIHLRKVGRDPANFDVREFAKVSEKYSGAEIEQAIQEALKNAFHEGEEDITDAHILNALRETQPMAKTMENTMYAIQSFAEKRGRSASSEKDYEYVKADAEDDKDDPFSKKRKVRNRLNEDDL